MPAWLSRHARGRREFALAALLLLPAAAVVVLAAVERSAALRGRVRARLGNEPDAFALSAYDGLRVAVRARQVAGGTGDLRRYKRAVARVAGGYAGASGRMRLNAAGDRAYDSYDFWSVCATGRGFQWRRTYAYSSTGVGRGRIVKRQSCRAA
jgi:ABC-type branched-subunit amino acid transport system substrate-binding protein